MMKSRMFRTTVLLSVIISVSLVIPLSLAGITSTAFISDNPVELREFELNNEIEIIVPEGDSTAYDEGSYSYVTDDGNLAHKLVNDEDGGESFAPKHHELTTEVTVSEGVPYCLYIVRPIASHVSGKTGQAYLKIEFEGTDYIINDWEGTSPPEYAYYSIMHTEADGYTLAPIADINDVTFMVFEEPIPMKITVERKKVGNIEPIVEIHIIFPALQ